MTLKQQFYNPRELSEILGVSQKTVYKLLHSGRLPYYRLQRMIKVDIRDLVALQEHIRSVTAEPEAGDE